MPKLRPWSLGRAGATASALAALVSGFVLPAHAGQGAGPEPIAPSPAGGATSARGLVVAQAPPPPAPQAQAQTQAPVQPQASEVWQKLPKMKLEAVYSGPLRDTIIQRWRDPVDGAVCHLYLPIIAPTSPVQPNGLVHYGPNGIGSISCHSAPPPPAAPRSAERRQPAATPAAPAQRPPAPATDRQ